MRRVIYGIPAAAVGIAVYVIALSLGPSSDLYNHVCGWLGLGAAVGLYGLADRMGLLPSAFESRPDLLHPYSDESDRKDDR